MFMRITWGKTINAQWISALAPDLVDLSRYKPVGLCGRWVAQDINDPENYYTVTIFDSLEYLDAWERSPAYLDEYLPAVSRYLVGTFSSSVCRVGSHSGYPFGSGHPRIEIAD